jgi:hypothetical protein
MRIELDQKQIKALLYVIAVAESEEVGDFESHVIPLLEAKTLLESAIQPEYITLPDGHRLRDERDLQ